MVKEDASLRNLEKKELLNKLITLDSITDQEYLNMVMQEALRFEAPVASATPVITLKDCTIGKYNIKKGHSLVVNFHGLHFNTKHWQKPYEFHPERFDKNHPLSKAPDGSKRHVYAWAPFNGGKRVCFGKTFAEMTMKTVMTYITSSFNFEHVNEKYREKGGDKDTYPFAHFGITGKREPILVKLTQYDGFQD